MGWKGAMQSWYSWAGTYTGTALSTLHWFLIWSPHNHVQFYYVPYFIVEKTEAQRGCAICWKCQSWDSNLRIPILKPSYSHPSRLCLCHTACMSLCFLTRDWTHTPALEGNHWTTREVPGAAFLLLYLLGTVYHIGTGMIMDWKGRLGVWTGLVKTTV